ncbi:glycosyltransferase [Elongatibacter sediminis]|uniref:glycosyltransferase n=1 Tax=Elongatibacter sediminis TaxID=3119006 RepID=UPI00339D3FAB
MSLCIIQGLNQFHSSSFIRAHVEMLAGEKVTLTERYPNLTFNGRQIRYFYSQKPWQKKLSKLLPHWLYEKRRSSWEETYAGRHDSIAAFMRVHAVDVILAEFGIHGSNICPHARDLGIPLIVHFHGHDVHRNPMLEGFQGRYQAMFEYAFRLISVSHSMIEKLIEMGADPAKIVYNPYGPRRSFLEIRPDYRKTLVAVGRFTDIKAPYLTLMAFRQALQEHPDASLVMGGCGELLETCKTLARTWKIEERVSFPGALRHEEVHELLENACGFVQHSVCPTYGDSEGTPVAILEAGAAGLPVVATRHAGIPDAVVEGVTGFLVDERDVDSMSKRMGCLLADVDKCRLMGRAAREHIQRNFSIDRHIGCLNELITQARGQVDARVKTRTSLGRSMTRNQT